MRLQVRLGQLRCSPSLLADRSINYHSPVLVLYVFLSILYKTKDTVNAEAVYNLKVEFEAIENVKAVQFWCL